MRAIVETGLVAFCGAFQNFFDLYRKASWYRNSHGTCGLASLGILSWFQGSPLYHFETLDISSRNLEIVGNILLNPGGSWNLELVGFILPKPGGSSQIDPQARSLGSLERHVALASFRSIPEYIARKSGSKVVGA
ncbi:hypothetical protein Bca4012_063390 [Brassica carinata]